MWKVSFYAVILRMLCSVDIHVYTCMCGHMRVRARTHASAHMHTKKVGKQEFLKNAISSAGCHNFKLSKKKKIHWKIWDQNRVVHSWNNLNERMVFAKTTENINNDYTVYQIFSFLFLGSELFSDWVCPHRI